MTCFVGRILQFKEAIQYNNIIIKNSNNIDITSTCKFSWSVDGVCWTNWTDYNTYINSGKYIDGDFYLKILFYSDLGDVILGGLINKCYNIYLDDSNIFLKDFCTEPNLFQPYNNLDCALQLQEQLSDSIICIFGIPIYYFKTNPNANTLDLTFKEYNLYNVSDVKQIKLMIQDGQLPSSNYKLTEFDFDWENDWETEISKSQFATAFGDNAVPHNNDFIYVPLLKRMYQVNSAYDERNEGLMWRSTTWKLSLVKFNDSTNINTGDYDKMIDGFIKNNYMDDIFPQESNEQHRQVGADPVSAPQYAGNSKLDLKMKDAVRSSCSESGVNIIDLNTCHYNKIIGRNLYKLSENSFINYQKRICGSAGTISFILYNDIIIPDKADFIRFGEVIISAEDNDNGTYIIFNNKKYNIEKNNTYMIICGWDRNTYSTKIDIYKKIHKPEIPMYMLRPESYWFDFENPIISTTDQYNEDFNMKKAYNCSINGPINITNIKYYNQFLSNKEAITESLRYVTNNEKCIINDLARPITDGYGYLVR